MPALKKEADNTIEILALVNLLIRKGIIYEEEIIIKKVEKFIKESYALTI